MDCHWWGTRSSRPLNLGTSHHLLSLQGRLVEPDSNGRFDKLDPILLYCGRISSPCKATRFELLWTYTLHHNIHAACHLKCFHLTVTPYLDEILPKTPQSISYPVAIWQRPGHTMERHVYPAIS